MADRRQPAAAPQGPAATTAAAQPPADSNGAAPKKSYYVPWMRAVSKIHRILDQLSPKEARRVIHCVADEYGSPALLEEPAAAAQAAPGGERPVY